MDLAPSALRVLTFVLLGLLLVAASGYAAPRKAANLRLVPFPKHVKLEKTGFTVPSSLQLAVS